MSIQVRLIRISPMTTAENSFFNFGFATRKPVGEVLKQLLAEKLTTQADIDLMVKEGLDLGKSATFSISENDCIFPNHVLRHIFDVENITLVVARDKDTKAVVKHGDNGQPCLNAVRAADDLYPVYTYVERGGSEVRGLPPAPAAEAVA